MSNPENAQMKAIYEFISASKFTETDKAPNKPYEVSTFMLQKKLFDYTKNYNKCPRTIVFGALIIALLKNKCSWNIYIFKFSLPCSRCFNLKLK